MKNRISRISGFRFFIGTLLFLLLGGTVRAQDSLAVYLEWAGKNNPGLQARYLEYAAELERVPQAGALPDPTVQWGFFLKPMALMEGNQIGNIQAMQMFPWFGALKAAKDEASQMALMKYEEASDARNLLYRQVKTAWLGVYQKKKEMTILNENLTLLHTAEPIVRNGGTYARHSSPICISDIDEDFKMQMTHVYQSYLTMKEAFVATDAKKVSHHAAQTAKSLAAVEMGLLKGEPHTIWMAQLKILKQSLQTIVGLTDIEKQRAEFVHFNTTFYQSIKTFGLKEVTVYYQYCPMANDDKGAYWLSDSKEIRNPYMGDKMLSCGETRETFQ